MSYDDTCDYLFRQTPSFEKSGKTGFNEGLANTLTLDAHYGHPHQAFKTIHVGGTNGKGSVSHTLAAHLQAAGYRVGLYTSPHLVDFRERIRVNGEMIPKQYVVNFVDDFLQWNASAPCSFEGDRKKLQPSFFELTTAMAFKFFRDQAVDIAVIEVGLGGRLDCTNIINPVLSVITNISFDHTDMLGDTLAKIAGEKAGIIKQGVPVVIGENVPETRAVFEAKARDMHSPITFADDTPLIEYVNEHYITREGIAFESDLKGIYQLKNTNTVLHALHVMKNLHIIKDIDYSIFNKVSSSTGLMARWQKMGDAPTIVCDTGHNPGGWQYISLQLASITCKKMHIVFGMVSDKDVETVMHMLPKHATYYFTKASTPRALNEEYLLKIGQKLQLQGQCYPSVDKAVNAALKAASTDDFIFIGGSTYVVAEYLKTTI